MTEKTKTLDDFLKHPDVKKVTGKINDELNERRSYSPELCEVFSSPYTDLKEMDQYRFELDPEARKKLLNIINNGVQAVTAKIIPRRCLLTGYSTD